MKIKQIICGRFRAQKNSNWKKYETLNLARSKIHWIRNLEYILQNKTNSIESFIAHLANVTLKFRTLHINELTTWGCNNRSLIPLFWRPSSRPLRPSVPTRVFAFAWRRPPSPSEGCWSTELRRRSTILKTSAENKWCSNFINQ
jgi:hypothetical protein